MENKKGIKFQLITRTQAVKFLSERNNYLRIASYRKNYPKYNDKYVGLDFKYLVELSTLDMHIRNLIMKMTTSIEHCLKVKLIRDIELDSAEDGYSIVNNFFLIPQNKRIINDIELKSQSQYCGELIQHYFKYTADFDSNGNRIYKYECPIWVLLEVISFGNFIKFYGFYYQNNKPHISEKLLNSVKSLRNACAHNNCILHDLHPSPKTKPPHIIKMLVSQIPQIGSDMCNKKLQNRFLLEFVTLLYVFDQIVSEDVKKYTYKELRNFSTKRLIRHIDYFDKQNLIKTSIEFLFKIIDFFTK